LKDCPDDYYLFGPGFKPSTKPMSEGLTSVYWKDFVKRDLGITKDFYSLKHLNTTEIVDKLNEEAAAELNGHTSTGMVRSIYDVKQPARQHAKLRDVGNSFA
jgi:hypothetical protein